MDVDSSAMEKACQVAFQDFMPGFDEDLPNPLDYPSWLPNEILIYIFSFLAPLDLYWTVRLVCRRWHSLYSIPQLWRWICADRDVPSDILCSWLKKSKMLRKLSIKDRNDADRIACVVCEYCPNLRSIYIENCAGSERRRRLKSWNICRLLCRCKYLEDIYFNRVAIDSCRFYRLLTFHRLRSMLTGDKWTYHGPANVEMLEAIVDDYFMEAKVTLNTFNELSISLDELAVKKRDDSLDIQNTISNIWGKLYDELYFDLSY